jgi:hypothetical protein
LCGESRLAHNLPMLNFGRNLIVRRHEAVKSS